MSFKTLLGLGVVLAVSSACADSPTQPGPPDSAVLSPATGAIVLSASKRHKEIKHNDGGLEIKAKGKRIQRALFGNPFTSLDYSFKAELEDDQTEGEFSGRGDGPDGIFLELSGDITCITVEADGVTARLGGVITDSESNLPVDASGQEAVWTVVAGDDGSARSTFVFASDAFPGLAQFHCDSGIPSTSLGGLVPVSAKIKVKVKG